MDYSLFDEASRDHDAETAAHRTAMVRVAVKEEIFPFLALATSEVEYGHRKALAYERLAAIAERNGVSLTEVEKTADRMYEYLHPTAAKAEPEMVLTAAMKCANCNHRSTDHTEGLQCGACGCSNFSPLSTQASKGEEGRRTTAEKEAGPFS